MTRRVPAPPRAGCPVYSDPRCTRAGSSPPRRGGLGRPGLGRRSRRHAREGGRAVEQRDDARACLSSSTIKAGGKTVTTLRMSGVERPRARVASFRYPITPAQPGLGAATILTRGSRRLHPLRQLRHSRGLNPRVKKWLFIDTNSSLGLNPAGLSSLGTKQLRAVKGLEVVGSGTEGGIPVTRYRGTLALARWRTPRSCRACSRACRPRSGRCCRGTSRSRSRSERTGTVRRFTSRSPLPLGRHEARITIDAELSASPIHRRSSSRHAPVMTLEQFQQATGTGASGADDRCSTSSRSARRRRRRRVQAVGHPRREARRGRDDARLLQPDIPERVTAERAPAGRAGRRRQPPGHIERGRDL